jgi:hypothetical protein
MLMDEMIFLLFYFYLLQGRLENIIAIVENNFPVNWPRVQMMQSGSGNLVKS